MTARDPERPNAAWVPAAGAIGLSSIALTASRKG